MTLTTSFDAYTERVTAGERLSADEIRELASSHDILAIGMLADTLARRMHESRVTFLRVAECAFDAIEEGAFPARAREIRITGSPATLEDAARSVERVKATGRTVTGLTWADIERFAAGGATATVLARLRAAGLEGLTTLPLDTTDVNGIVGQLADNGFTNIRFTVDKAPATDRVALFMSADALQDRFGCIRALNPLPMTLSAFKPTTGYDDVKMVALARLAAPGIPTIQVDWRRYGPKLAQVALSFGADDIDGVSGSDEAPEGRRRGPLEEIRRNIEAAGFQPVERDGRFTPLG